MEREKLAAELFPTPKKRRLDEKPSSSKQDPMDGRANNPQPQPQGYREIREVSGIPQHPPQLRNGYPAPSIGQNPPPHSRARSSDRLYEGYYPGGYGHFYPPPPPPSHQQRDGNDQGPKSPIPPAAAIPGREYEWRGYTDPYPYPPYNRDVYHSSYHDPMMHNRETYNRDPPGGYRGPPRPPYPPYNRHPSAVDLGMNSHDRGEELYLAPGTGGQESSKPEKAHVTARDDRTG